MSKKFVTFVYLAFLAVVFAIVDSHSNSVIDTLLSFALPFIGASLLYSAYFKGDAIDEDPLPKSRAVLRQIKKARSILLHCHPSPDPDSLGSVLAMKFALQKLGKKVTVIRGDSELSPGFLHFAGVQEIEHKSFGEVDLKNFD